MHLFVIRFFSGRGTDWILTGIPFVVCSAANTSLGVFLSLRGAAPAIKTAPIGAVSCTASLLFVVFPTSLVEMVATVLFLAPLGRDIVLPAPLGLVIALDPDVLATIGVIPVIPRRDDVTCASGHLLIYGSRGRNIDVDAEVRRMCRKRSGERSCKCNCQAVLRMFIESPLCDRDRRISMSVDNCQSKNAEPPGFIDTKSAGETHKLLPTLLAGKNGKFTGRSSRIRRLWSMRWRT